MLIVKFHSVRGKKLPPVPDEPVVPDTPMTDTVDSVVEQVTQGGSIKKYRTDIINPLTSRSHSNANDKLRTKLEQVKLANPENKLKKFISLNLRK